MFESDACQRYILVPKGESGDICRNNIYPDAHSETSHVEFEQRRRTFRGYKHRKDAYQVNTYVEILIRRCVKKSTDTVSPETRKQYVFALPAADGT